jgi:hypothetical protein
MDFSLNKTENCCIKSTCIKPELVHCKIQTLLLPWGFHGVWWRERNKSFPMCNCWRPCWTELDSAWKSNCHMSLRRTFICLPIMPYSFIYISPASMVTQLNWEGLISLICLFPWYSTSGPLCGHWPKTHYYISCNLTPIPIVFCSKWSLKL